MAKTPSARPVELFQDITVEIEKALRKLGANPAECTTDIYEFMRQHGAKSDLLGIVSSYQDQTQDDDWTLRNLRLWNARLSNGS